MKNTIFPYSLSLAIRKHEPQYRSHQRMHTPSHANGMTDEAIRRLEDLKRRDRNRGNANM